MKRRRISVSVPAAVADLLEEILGNRELVLEDVNELDGLVSLITTARPK